MKAIQIHAFGDDFGRLVPVEVPEPQAGPETAVVRVVAASINPSDLKNVQGAMKQTTLPRIPGRDFAGVVEKGPTAWIGAEVWGTGDGGFTRDGSHAQKIAVPVASLARKPSKLGFDAAATVGVSFMAAWCGLVEAAALQRGETLLVLGASGAVGGAAAQIARRIGARVIAVDRREPAADAPIQKIAEKIIIGAPDSPAVREASGGRGADVVFDTVGGVLFRAALAALALRGRLVEISSTGGREVGFDLVDFYHNESRLLGVDTLKRDLVASSKILGELSAGFESGDYQPAAIAETFPLSAAAQAYRRVAAGSPGRVVLHPQD